MALTELTAQEILNLCFDSANNRLNVSQSRNWEWVHFHDFTNFASAVAGSGVVTKALRAAIADTDTTAGSTALIRTGVDVLWSAGQDEDIISFSKKMVLSIKLYLATNTDNGVSRIGIGKTTAAGFGAPATKYVGLHIARRTLSGIVHDGTTLTTVALNVTPAAAKSVWVVIYSDGARNVSWWVDNTYKATTALGPTGLSSSSANVFQIESGNLADAAKQIVAVAGVGLGLEQ